MTTRKYITAPEAARILVVTPSAVYAAIKAGKIKAKATMNPARLKVLASSVDAYEVNRINQGNRKGRE